MKKGWELKTLAEACQIKPPKDEARRKLSEKEMVSFVPMEDLGINQKILIPAQKKPLSNVINSYTYFADGDVLMAKITPCFENGKLGIAANLNNGIGFGSSEYIVFRPNKHLDKEWLYYFLSREAFRVEGAQRMNGAVGHKRVAKEFIEAYPIPIPPLPEQKRIVAILDKAFEAIATAKANAEKNLQNARDLFESHLNDVFTQRGEGWEEKRLGELCDFSQGVQVDVKLQSEIKKSNAQVRFLRIVDFTQGNEPARYIDDPGTRFFVCSSDVSLVRYGASTGFVCSGLDGVIANNLFRVQPKHNQINKKYLYWFLKSELFQGVIRSSMNGAAMPAISFGMINKITFPFPDQSEQKKIVIRLDDLDLKARHLESIYKKKITTLNELKKALLHQAFSGEL